MQPANMTCSQCGRAVGANDRFCAICGTVLSISRSIAPSTGDTLLNDSTGVPSLPTIGKLLPETLLGPNRRYRIGRRIGRGGFGEAYLARDLHLDRLCVVKRLILQPSWDSQTKQLTLHNFEREARLLVTLNTPGHPNIPEIYEYLAENQCLIMKYIEGQSLFHVLKRRIDPLPEEVALRYIRDACSALAYMHSRAPEPVIHRDIKPDNILLDTAGRIWLIDFGLGKVTSRQSRQSRNSLLSGTPGYAPPEQWQGNAEPGSDMYALAATLHTLLTNRHPLGKRANAPSITPDPPPVRQLNPAVRPEVERLIQRGMALDVAARPTAQDFLAELEALLAQPTIPPPPEPSHPPEIAQFVGRDSELVALSAQLTGTGLVVITGLPGVGKTTLAAMLARKLDDPSRVFWHSFHQEEGIDIVLWKLAAFLARQGRNEMWRLLHSSGRAGGQPQPPEVLLDYLLQLIHRQDYVLCFDDFQFVENDPHVDQLIERFRAELRSGGLALIVTSRHQPTFMPRDMSAPLAGLTHADTHRLLATREIVLSSELLGSLYDSTQGNTQLLLLAIDAIRKSAEPARLIARLSETSNIERYLMTEVDQHLTAEERAVMSAVAVLSGHSGTRDAIEAILDSVPVGLPLYELCKRSLLTMHVSGAANEYVQHAIMQSFYYKLVGRRERQIMHRRAGTYYEVDDPDMLRAAQHFERAGEHERAAQLATTNIWALIHNGQVQALRCLLEQFTAKHISPMSWIAVAMASGETYKFLRESQIARDSYAEALAQLRMLPESQEIRLLRARACRGMSELLEPEAPKEALVWVRRGLDELASADVMEEAALYLRQGSALIAIGDNVAALTALKESLRLLPETPTDWRASVLMSMGVVYCSQGDIERGKACHMQALEIYEQFGNIRGMISIRHNLGIEMEIAGNWVGAAHEYQQALDLTEQLGSVGHRTDLELSLGILQTKRGNSMAALAHLSRCLELGQHYGLSEYIAACQASLADLWIRLADWEQAEISLAEADRLAHALDTKYQLPEIEREWAQLRLAQGDQAAALRHAERSVALARELDSDLDQGIGLRVLGQVLLADNQYAEGMGTYSKSLAILSSRDPYEAARTRVQWGTALRISADDDQALALIHEARAAFQALGAQHDLQIVNHILQA
jgi:tRNA A-37 threonylcarbamoyl transferase component Bud32/tetratricopeptide (TPR) repeat protein